MWYVFICSFIYAMTLREDAVVSALKKEIENLRFSGLPKVDSESKLFKSFFQNLCVFPLSYAVSP